MQERAIEKGEITIRSEFTSTFQTEAAVVRDRISLLSEEDWGKVQEELVLLAQKTPDMVIVGGVALRHRLSDVGYLLPAADIHESDDEDELDVGIDIDVVVPVERNEELREIFPVLGENTFFNGKRSITVVDKPQNRRIDIFYDSGLDSTEFSLINGQLVRLATAEELFIKRVEQFREVIQESSIDVGKNELLVFYLFPNKIIDYLYLNSMIVDVEKLERLAQERGYENNFLGIVLKLHHKLKKGMRTVTHTMVR